jgi:hypothetical protein
MTWVKIDDCFPDHPKIKGLKDDEFRLYITALCYSSRYLTDGVIPLNIVRTFIESRSKVRRISALVEANLWKIEAENVIILSYSEYQFTKDRIQTERENSKKRIDRFRSRRENNGNVTPLQTEKQHRPIPIPIPIPIKDIKIYQSPSEIDFNSFWEVYPRRQGKGHAKSAWEKAVKKVAPEIIIESAKKFALDPNRDEQFTPHPSTWLNQERWGDEALPAKNSNTRSESSAMRAMDIVNKFREIEDANESI